MSHGTHLTLFVAATIFSGAHALPSTKIDVRGRIRETQAVVGPDGNVKAEDHAAAAQPIPTGLDHRSWHSSDTQLADVTGDQAPHLGTANDWGGENRHPGTGNGIYSEKPGTSNAVDNSRASASGEKEAAKRIIAYVVQGLLLFMLCASIVAGAFYVHQERQRANDAARSSLGYSPEADVPTDVEPTSPPTAQTPLRVFQTALSRGNAQDATT